MAASASIGIVGIGAMGLPMARRLQACGQAPAVRDIDPQTVAAAQACGLVACDSAAALAERCDTIVVVVVDAAQVDDVLFGDGGVVHAARAQTVVLCSTIAPGDTERCRDRLAAHRIATVDAPVSGGPARAEHGTLSMMVAAERAVLARCEPLLRALASSLHVVGERVGDAARVKLVNNMLAGIHLAAGAEAFVLGTRLGLDPRLLADVIGASSGASWIVADRMARALAGDSAPRARTRILAKDLGLALQLAQAAGVQAPLAHEALAAFRATVDAGFGDADDAAVITHRIGAG
jgi:3-hydroxyisobutyrate dehydrogenase